MLSLYQNRSYHTIAILHVSKVLLALSLIASYRMWDTHAASDDVNVPAQNLLVESDHTRLANYIRRHLILRGL